MLPNVTSNSIRLERLRLECVGSELGQILISYQIPIEARSRLLGVSSIKGLLKFMFKSADRAMSEKLTDALNLARVYEKLKGVRLVEPIDCYYLFVVVLIQEMRDEDKV